MRANKLWNQFYQIIISHVQLATQVGYIYIFFNFHNVFVNHTDY